MKAKGTGMVAKNGFSLTYQEKRPSCIIATSTNCIFISNLVTVELATDESFIMDDEIDFEVWRVHFFLYQYFWVTSQYVFSFQAFLFFEMHRAID